MSISRSPTFSSRTPPGRRRPWRASRPCPTSARAWRASGSCMAQRWAARPPPPRSRPRNRGARHSSASIRRRGISSGPSRRERSVRMTIKVGDKMPEGKLGKMGSDGPQKVTTDELFKGKTVVLFSVPGAFTPTCDAKHLPGFVELADQFKAKGIDTVACMAVNDVFVMNAWGKASHVDGKVLMLADGNGDYARALGLELDGRGFGMGMRGQRFAIVVDNGTARQVAVEAPGQFKVS